DLFACFREHLFPIEFDSLLGFSNHLLAPRGGFLSLPLDQFLAGRPRLVDDLLRLAGRLLEDLLVLLLRLGEFFLHLLRVLETLGDFLLALIDRREQRTEPKPVNEEGDDAKTESLGNQKRPIDAEFPGNCCDRVVCRCQDELLVNHDSLLRNDGASRSRRATRRLNRLLLPFAISLI